MLDYAENEVSLPVGVVRADYGSKLCWTPALQGEEKFDTNPVSTSLASMK